jgi:hypothetical protein
MFELILLAAAIAGIASLARGRGGNPWFFGILAGGGWLVGTVIARLVFGPQSVAIFVIPWAFVGLAAFNARFVLGATRPKPDGMWTCPDCHTLNDSSYVVCEACQRPWAPDGA